jgi:glycosyltransferase involved in cell wall biosynthesis
MPRRISCGRSAGSRTRGECSSGTATTSDLLAAADVFAMPSRYEGTAGAAIEALALEAPIVASDLDGTRGLLIDGVNALLVPAADPVELRRAIERVLADPAGAHARTARGRHLFETRFTLARSATRMVELYHEVAALPGRPALGRARGGGDRRPAAGAP